MVRSANSLSLAGMFKYVDTLSSLLKSGGRLRRGFSFFPLFLFFPFFL